MASIPTFLAAQRFQTSFSRLSLQLFDLQRQTGSGAKADDLKGLGGNAASVVNARALIADDTSRQDAASRLSARLTMQDISFNQANDGVKQLRDAISSAMVSGQPNDLMDRLENAFAQTVGAMNASHEGQYLFAGERRDTAPVAVSALSDLENATDIDSIFRVSARDEKIDLGGGMSYQTSERASTISAGLFATYRDLYAVVKTLGSGAALTEAQRDRLASLDQSLAAGQGVLLQAQGANGANQNRLNADVDRLKANTTAIQGRLADISDADLAQVASQLTALQTQYQAAASVYNQMRSLTLVNFLN